MKWAASILSIFLFLSCATSGRTDQDSKNLELLEKSVGAESSKTEKAEKQIVDGKYEEALATLKRCSEPEASFLRALAFLQLGKIQDAEKEFDSSIKSGIKVSESRYNLGLIASEKGDQKRAKSEMEKVLSMTPDHAGANYFMGSYYYGEGSYEKAQSHFRSCVKKSPGSREAWEGLFYTLLSMKKFENAWEAGENIDRSSDRNIANLLLLAGILKRYDDGVKIFRQHNKTSPEIVAGVLPLLVRKGELEAALELAVKRVPGSLTILDSGKVGDVRYIFFLEKGTDLKLAAKKGGDEKRLVLKRKGANVSINGVKFLSYSELISAIDNLFTGK